MTFVKGRQLKRCTRCGASAYDLGRHARKDGPCDRRMLLNERNLRRDRLYARGMVRCPIPQFGGVPFEYHKTRVAWSGGAISLVDRAWCPRWVAELLVLTSYHREWRRDCINHLRESEDSLAVYDAARRMGASPADAAFVATRLVPHFQRQYLISLQEDSKT